MGIIGVIFNLLASLAGIYSFIIFVRVMLSWFSGGGRGYGTVEQFLSTITDPYLGWFRRFSFLRIGFLDLSPIAAMAMLSLAQNLFSAIAGFGKISLGIILAIALSSIWAAVFFLVGFFTLILVLRLVAYLANLNIRHPFWRIVDGISQPVVFRIGQFFFPRRIGNYLSRLILAVITLLAANILGSAAARFLSEALIRLPV